MKIIICGKGGSGKSTISTLTAKALRKRGFNVLLIDADESNIGLHRMIGVSEPINLMDNLGGKSGFKQKINRPFSSASDKIFKNKMRIDEISEDCIKQIDGVKLIAIGKIHDPGEGCACPMGMLSKMILSRLVLGNNDIIIIDSAAGIEHFGRGIDIECDLMLFIVDPVFESFMLGKKMLSMADKAKKDFFFILNKVDGDVIDVMTAGIDQKRVVAKIPKNGSIFLSSLEGKKITANIPEIDTICSLIEKKKQEYSQKA